MIWLLWINVKTVLARGSSHFYYLPVYLGGKAYLRQWMLSEKSIQELIYHTGKIQSFQTTMNINVPNNQNSV